jgi:hypothetical protein
MTTFSVFCPTGSDRFQDFSGGSGQVDDFIHAPINYHGYAACMKGRYHKTLDTISRDEVILLLLNGRHARTNLKIIKQLKASGNRVLTAFKETGLQQILPQISQPRTLSILNELFAYSDGCISSTKELVPIYRSLSPSPVEFIPTPYPVNDLKWDFSIPIRQRRGIFLGTREFFQWNRNHLYALLLLKQVIRETGEPLTVMSTDCFRGKRLLKNIGLEKTKLRIIGGRIPYSRYLCEMARHKLVFQLDQSTVPGQVAGDAILCGLPCVGGNGTIESIAFSELSSRNLSMDEARDIAVAICRRPSLQEKYSEEARKRARSYLSFEVVADRLRTLLEQFQKADGKVSTLHD